MRTLVLLRGAPGSGKSTWIRKHNLESWTIEADAIRVLVQPPILTTQGNWEISQKNDGTVWGLIFNILEQRMKTGELTIVDATHYKSTLLTRYKKLAEQYRYRQYIVDFTNISKEELLKRNASRGFKAVPETVIEKMYEVFQNDTEVNTRFNIIDPNIPIEESLLNQAHLITDHTNNYTKISVIGDIHGCITPVQAYFKAMCQKNEIDNTLFIFIGDYIDRGIQNKETIEFLDTIKNRPNVILCEGNHERWLRIYAQLKTDDMTVINENIKSQEFIKNTLPQIRSIDKSILRNICRKFVQMAYIRFHGKNYTICHGGISRLPSLKISAQQLIKGVGKYEDTNEIYQAWMTNTNKDNILVHGHRNVSNIPTCVNERIYNLCGNVEQGKELRIVEFTKNHTNILEIKNPVWDKSRLTTNLLRTTSEETTTQIQTNPNILLERMRSTKLISAKDLGDGITSYNFSKKAFYARRWNELTCIARGLFVETSTNKIVARSYEKFFNWGETDAYKSVNLKERLKFPVKAYRKENGFLGLISYNFIKDDIFIATKSTNTGNAVNIFKEILKKHYQDKLPEYLGKMKQYCKDNNVTLVFEVVDPVNDPHVIEYKDTVIFLLDIIRNEFRYETLDYDTVKRKAIDFKLPHKAEEYIFNSWEELYDFKHQQDKSYDVHYEGWVFVDQNNFKIKYKTNYYKFWRRMRTIKQTMEARHTVRKIYVDMYEVRVHKILANIPPEKLKEYSIIDIQKIYDKLYPKICPLKE